MQGACQPSLIAFFKGIHQCFFTLCVVE
jgi:hypothetical protein